ncbi:MAG: hypothetical protein OJF49_002239 [Ktedonobacterales bacterium]|nr:MAG: hypothetical protein OJF49_002239 [Ktedonobacterales bacterium]
MLSTRLKSGGRFLSLALLGGITLSPVAAAPMRAAPVASNTTLTWITFEGSWLCRSWSSGGVLGNARQQRMDGVTEVLLKHAGTDAYTTGDALVHCTLRWHVDAQGRLISDAPSWVPNPTGAWPDTPNDVPDPAYAVQRQYARTPAAKSAPKVVKHLPAPRSASHSSKSSTGGGTPPPPPPSGGYNPWQPVPGHPTYTMHDFAGDPWSQFFGVCTWYAWYRHQSEPLEKLGPATNWPSAAPHYGLRVGTTPVVGASVVFMPGVEGAGSGGHAGHVEAVLGGGWFIISEMNFYWNGGGWGRVDWRYVYVHSGVYFIY